MGNLAIRKEKNLKNKIIQAPYEQNISRLKKQKKNMVSSHFRKSTQYKMAKIN